MNISHEACQSWSRMQTEEIVTGLLMHCASSWAAPAERSRVMGLAMNTVAMTAQASTSGKSSLRTLNSRASSSKPISTKNGIASQLLRVCVPIKPIRPTSETSSLSVISVFLNCVSDQPIESVDSTVIISSMLP